MSTMTASETCSCGAQIQLTAWPPHALSALDNWRRDHRHEHIAWTQPAVQWSTPIFETMDDQ